LAHNFSVTIYPHTFTGSVEAIPSKSHLHRLLICASLADEETIINCAHTDAEDISATINCLKALGAKIERIESAYKVTPLKNELLPKSCTLPCMESGSTLRFMLPIVSALGISGEFHLAGRLGERPILHLENELMRNGIQIIRPCNCVISCKGQLQPGQFYLPGNISSQYISGLLMALPLLSSDSKLIVSEPIESENYISLTLNVLDTFGQKIFKNRNFYEIKGGAGFRGPQHLSAEGDWSNAAFWLAAGAMPGGDIKLTGLCKNSLQGDSQVCKVLKQMGTSVKWDGDTLFVSEGKRRNIEIDAAHIPDLIPPLAAVSAVSEGCTTIRNAARLRLKESDRLSAISNCLNALGAKVSEKSDGLRIEGVSHLKGGIIDSCGDHRIAMMAAVASAACTETVTIKNAQAVNKSYPNFFEKLSKLGKQIEVHNE